MTLPIPAFAEIRAAFEAICQKRWNGVRGIELFNSGKPGPTVGITMMTHGNEPSGLAPYWYYTQVEPLLPRLHCGKVVFILSNLDAAERYFALPANASMDERISTRGIALNMNRLPEDILTLHNDSRSEVTRVQELAPLWATFDTGMDIHSTSLESAPMIVGHPTVKAELIKGFPIDVLISGISSAMRLKPAFHFYGTQRTDSSHLLIETGSHENPLSFQRAIACAEALLANMGLLEQVFADDAPAVNYLHYAVTSSLYFPNESYRTTEIFPNFAPITKGQILAAGNGAPLLAEHDGHALMCFATGKPPCLKEEALFLSQPVKTLRL
ncbi:MAG: hypothetical protein DI628_02825 [Blastochloris viridis]|uniref:Succinylglutamate desuccinylase n=1 Tax=Blastochloris viridis TaxID=1079 RepID=A0A6N4RC40_BLAVI|nr:MAG: hypothetical protein DI628_02825 [Blastochloris viridis]